MANNCLVTKLKGIVDNDNLWKLGETRIPVINGNDLSLWLLSETKINGLNGTLINGQSTVTLQSGWASGIAISGISEGEIGYLQVENKYNLSAILGKNTVDLRNDNFDEVFSGIKLRQIGIRYANASLEQIVGIIDPNYNLGRFEILGGFWGNLSTLFPYKDFLTESNFALGSYGLADTINVTGTFDELGHFYKVNAWGNSPTMGLKLHGTVEGFVANRLEEQPATAGSVTFSWLGYEGYVTFNGVSIDSSVAYHTVSWDAQGNITLTPNN